MKATAERVGQYVFTRTKSGAPRKFLAKVGAVDGNYRCYCPKGGQGCSHEQALMALLEQESHALKAQPAHVVA